MSWTAVGGITGILALFAAIYFPVANELDLPPFGDSRDTPSNPKIVYAPAIIRTGESAIFIANGEDLRYRPGTDLFWWTAVGGTIEEDQPSEDNETAYRAPLSPMFDTVTVEMGPHGKTEAIKSG